MSESSQYSLRNSNDIRTIRCQSQIYSTSFLPSVISEWNTFPENVRTSDLSSFKNYLNGNKNVIPPYFYTGHRKAQTLHTRLRTNCSALNLSLFQKNIVESPLCSCGDIESTDHFLLRCHLYDIIRTELLNRIGNLCTITIKILLFGNPNLSNEVNTEIFEAVQIFIIKSKRFD